MLHYYIIDLETTGLDCKKHETSQISIIRCNDRHQLNRFIKVEHPEKADQRALDATGRTRADLYKGIPKREAVEAIESFLLEDGQTPEHRCMIAHNAPFDKRFVVAMFDSLNKTFPVACWLDTLSVMKYYSTRILGLPKQSVKLHDSLKICGIKPRDGAHDAVSDTQNLYILRDHLIKQGVDFLPYIKRESLSSEETTETED